MYILKPLLGPAFKHVTDFGANFDRLDLHQAVNESKVEGYKEKALRVFWVFDLLWPSIPSLPAKKPWSQAFAQFLFLIFLQHNLRDRANKTCVFISKKNTPTHFVMEKLSIYLRL